jgi:hypothetical protein
MTADKYHAVATNFAARHLSPFQWPSQKEEGHGSAPAAGGRTTQPSVWQRLTSRRTTRQKAPAASPAPTSFPSASQALRTPYSARDSSDANFDHVMQRSAKLLKPGAWDSQVQSSLSSRHARTDSRNSQNAVKDSLAEKGVHSARAPLPGANHAALMARTGSLLDQLKAANAKNAPSTPSVTPAKSALPSAKPTQQDFRPAATSGPSGGNPSLGSQFSGAPASQATPVAKSPAATKLSALHSRPELGMGS